MAHSIKRKKTKWFLEQPRQCGTWILERIFTCSDWTMINKSPHYYKSSSINLYTSHGSITKCIFFTKYIFNQFIYIDRSPTRNICTGPCIPYRYLLNWNFGGTLRENYEVEIIIVKHLDTQLEFIRERFIFKICRKSGQRELNSCDSKNFSEFPSQRIKIKNWIKMEIFILHI